MALQAAGRLAEALAAYERALALRSCLDPQQPRHCARRAAPARRGAGELRSGSGAEAGMARDPQQSRQCAGRSGAARGGAGLLRSRPGAAAELSRGPHQSRQRAQQSAAVRRGGSELRSRTGAQTGRCRAARQPRRGPRRAGCRGCGAAGFRPGARARARLATLRLDVDPLAADHSALRRRPGVPAHALPRRHRRPDGDARRALFGGDPQSPVGVLPRLPQLRRPRDGRGARPALPDQGAATRLRVAPHRELAAAG